jgi:hypothetical protein
MIQKREEYNFFIKSEKTKKQKRKIECRIVL